MKSSVRNSSSLRSCSNLISMKRGANEIRKYSQETTRKVDKRLFQSAPSGLRTDFTKLVSKVIQSGREHPPAVGYGELLRSNRSFRFLWLGQVVSQMGDWFDTIAVYTITLRLTGSTRSVALIMVARFLPSVVMGPLSGVVADRFSRRSIMITADLLRAVVVLGFLFIRRPDQMWLVYVLTVMQLAFSAFFEPATTTSESRPANCAHWIDERPKQCWAAHTNILAPTMTMTVQ